MKGFRGMLYFRVVGETFMQIANHYVAHLKLIECYMSVSQLKKKKKVATQEKIESPSTGGFLGGAPPCKWVLSECLPARCQASSPLPRCVPGMLLVGPVPRPRGKTQRHYTGLSPKHHLARWPHHEAQLTRPPHPLHTSMLRASNWLYSQGLPDSWGFPLIGMMETKINKEENLWGKRDCAKRKKLIKSLISLKM